MGKQDFREIIPVLRKEDYFHWKLKMHLHLLLRKFSYVKCIENELYFPMKIVTSVTVDGNLGPNRFEPKLTSEFT